MKKFLEGLAAGLAMFLPPLLAAMWQQGVFK
jgi:hypothetical protein